MDVIVNLFIQLALTVGIIVAFGFFIAFCRRSFCRIVGYGGSTIILATGIVGTPIHELSHALMCLVFGHRITEIKLYTPGSNDGTLGYVNHAYNPRNLYHQIGNFFIGIAPITCGSGVLFLLMLWMTPAVFDGVMLALNAGTGDFGAFFAALGTILGVIFNPVNMTNFWWWIYIILALMIASHMELSTADIRGGLGGFLFIAGALLVVDIILGISSAISGAPILQGFTTALTAIAAPVAGFLALSAVFSIAMLVIALIIRIIRSLAHR